MDPLETGQGSLVTCRAHFGNHCFRLYFVKKMQPTLTAKQANTISTHVVQFGITFHITNCWQVFFLCAYYSQHQLNTQKIEFN